MENDVIDYASWENLDEATIQNEVTALLNKVGNVYTLLETMVEKNEYEKTEKAFSDLWMYDLAPGGWLFTFYNTNKRAFGEYADKGIVPAWYAPLPHDQQKLYDMVTQYYKDASGLIKPVEKLREIMMLLPLKNVFKYMRTAVNFELTGFGTELYHQIDQYVTDIDDILNKTDNMERYATTSARFYEQNSRSMSPDSLRQGYRQARIKDHQATVDAYKVHEIISPNSNGTYTIKSNFLAEMKVIDKYTLELTILPNISDDLNRTLADIPKLNESLRLAWKNSGSNIFMTLANSLIHLLEVIEQFSKDGLHVWTCFKDRDDDSPYCYIRKLPAFSNMRGWGSFMLLTGDPWLDGTAFYNLFKNAERSLGEHCSQFIYRVHPELR